MLRFLAPSGGNVPPNNPTAPPEFAGQQFNSAEGLATHLLTIKGTSKADYWKYLDVLVVVEGELRTVKLVCKLCNEHLTYTNPSQTGKSHLGTSTTVGGCAYRTSMRACVAVDSRGSPYDH